MFELSGGASFAYPCKLGDQITGNATLDITGTVGDNSHTVSYTLDAYNLNSIGAELGVTVGEMTSTATSTWNPSESSSTDPSSRPFEAPSHTPRTRCSRTPATVT